MDFRHIGGVSCFSWVSVSLVSCIAPPLAPPLGRGWSVRLLLDHRSSVRSLICWRLWAAFVDHSRRPRDRSLARSIAPSLVRRRSCYNIDWEFRGLNNMAGGEFSLGLVCTRSLSSVYSLWDIKYVHTGTCILDWTVTGFLLLNGGPIVIGVKDANTDCKPMVEAELVMAINFEGKENCPPL